MERCIREDMILRTVATKRIRCIQCGGVSTYHLLKTEPYPGFTEEDSIKAVEDAKSADVSCGQCGSIFKNVPDSMVWN